MSCTLCFLLPIQRIALTDIAVASDHATDIYIGNYAIQAEF